MPKQKTNPQASGYDLLRGQTASGVALKVKGFRWKRGTMGPKGGFPRERRQLSSAHDYRVNRVSATPNETSDKRRPDRGHAYRSSHHGEMVFLVGVAK